MINGSCLCHLIQYKISAIPEEMNICHCGMCRKMSGSAYGVFAHIKRSNFEWIAGKENISCYQSSRDNIRNFCSKCGSNVPNEDGDYICIPAGTFNTDPGIKPSLQIFTSSKAPWHTIDPRIDSFGQFPPGD